ncbi:Embryonic protein UVS.2, partial [Orchesella cincta]
MKATSKICVITAIFQIFGAAAETQDLTEAGCIIMGHATQLKTRNSLTAQRYRWIREFNVQPSPSFDEWDVALITKAMAELQEALHCLKFRVFPANSTLRGDHIRIWKGKVCSSYVGRQGGAQPIYLTSPGCMAVGLIQHELLHALGFTHDSMRQYSTWLEIPVLYKSFATVANYGVPYNVGSVMHYSSRAFSVDRNHPSIVQKNGELIPVPSGLQDTDIMKLRRMYNCK